MNALVPKRARPREHAALPAVLFGLLAFPLLQGASSLFMAEGIITLTIKRSLMIGVVRAEPEPAPEPAPPPDPTRRYAVMIDNHPGAWPQSGIERADYVFELLVEGGITRLMAVFQNGVAEKIGPARSARPYFLEYAKEFDAVYAHVGGSDEALRLLRNGTYGLDDADQFRFGGFFWRDDSRYAPHNTYTSTAEMRDLIADRGWRTESEVVPADVRSDIVPEGEPAASVEIVPSRGSRIAEYRWNAETRGFDRVGHPQSPANLVVMENAVVPGYDPQSKGIVAMDTEGSGRAVVFRDGIAVEGIWKKEGSDAQTQFYLPNGEKIPFSEGQVWIHAIAPNRGGTLFFE